MDTKWAAVLILGVVGWRPSFAEDALPIQVYVQADQWTQSMGITQRMTDGLFREVGVRLIWHAGDLPKAGTARSRRIGIRIVKQAPASASEHALAGAQPYAGSGTLISVYQDRIQGLIARLPSVSDVILAYVLAHELGHVMMGNDYHSDSGIMKARWSHEDYQTMRLRRLRFTSPDSSRIREALSIEEPRGA